MKLYKEVNTVEKQLYSHTCDLCGKNIEEEEYSDGSTRLFTSEFIIESITGEHCHCCGDDRIKKSIDCCKECFDEIVKYIEEKYKVKFREEEY